MAKIVMDILDGNTPDNERGKAQYFNIKSAKKAIEDAKRQ